MTATIKLLSSDVAHNLLERCHNGCARDSLFLSFPWCQTACALHSPLSTLHCPLSTGHHCPLSTLHSPWCLLLAFQSIVLQPGWALMRHTGWTLALYDVWCPRAIAATSVHASGVAGLCFMAPTLPWPIFSLPHGRSLPAWGVNSSCKALQCAVALVLVPRHPPAMSCAIVQCVLACPCDSTILIMVYNLRSMYYDDPFFEDWNGTKEQGQWFAHFCHNSSLDPRPLVPPIVSWCLHQKPALHWHMGQRVVVAGSKPREPRRPVVCATDASFEWECHSHQQCRLNSND